MLIEIKDRQAKIHKIEEHCKIEAAEKLRKAIKNMQFVSFIKGRIDLDSECEIRENGGQWHKLSEPLRRQILICGGVEEAISNMKKAAQDRLQILEKFSELSEAIRNGKFGTLKPEDVKFCISNFEIVATDDTDTQGTDPEMELSKSALYSACLGDTIFRETCQLHLQAQTCSALMRLSTGKQDRALASAKRSSASAVGALATIAAVGKLQSIDENLEDVHEELGLDE